MYDVEGIGNAVSEQLKRPELSESAKDYFYEGIPTETDWEMMSAEERTESQALILERMQEVCDQTYVREADVAKLIPEYIKTYPQPVFSCENISVSKDLPFCDEWEFNQSCKLAVENFASRDPYREITYANADLSLRADYMQDFYDNYSEFTGYKSRLEFEEMPCDTNLGAYNPDTNTITLNCRLLENSDPRMTMETILHESRHTFQQYAVDHPDRVTVDTATIETWRDNLANYIRPEWDFEAYTKQPVEADADNFAAAMMGLLLN